jgi:peptidoglycan/LPS O-acetylase OafA/YrhL
MLVVFLLVVPHIKLFSRYNYFWVTPGTVYPYWLYLTNLYRELGLGTHSFLCVAWSLAIEEQYYLVWPLTVWLTNSRQLGVISLILFCGTALLRAGLFLFAGDSAMHLYHFTFTHLDGIALGSALAIAHSNQTRWGVLLERYARTAPFLGAAVLVLVLQAGLHTSPDLEHAYQPSMVLTYWLTALFYGSLLVASLRRGPIKALFSNSWLRTLGKYSYAAYLYQFVAAWVVQVTFGHLRARFSFLPDIERGWWRLFLVVLEIGATYGLAALSWRVLEGPLNEFKDRTPALQAHPRQRARSTVDETSMEERLEPAGR